MVEMAVEDSYSIAVNGTGPSGIFHMALELEDLDEVGYKDIGLCIRSVSWWPLKELWFRATRIPSDILTTASSTAWHGLRASSTLQKLVFIRSLELKNFLLSLRGKREQKETYPNLQVIWVCDEMADLADACDALSRALVLRPWEETPQALQEIHVKVSPSPKSQGLNTFRSRLMQTITKLRERFIVHYTRDEGLR